MHRFLIVVLACCSLWACGGGDADKQGTAQATPVDCSSDTGLTVGGDSCPSRQPPNYVTPAPDGSGTTAPRAVPTNPNV